jgi:hypothetical protein
MVVKVIIHFLRVRHGRGSTQQGHQCPRRHGAQQENAEGAGDQNGIRQNQRQRIHFGSFPLKSKGSRRLSGESSLEYSAEREAPYSRGAEKLIDKEAVIFFFWICLFGRPFSGNFRSSGKRGRSEIGTLLKKLTL